jgi:diacylglycerol O-acyltransferase
MTEFMSNSDAFTWAMEADPRLRSTVVTVVLLERAPDWAAVRELFHRMSATLPMFRQRVVASPPPAPPRWEDDPNFDLDYHMRRIPAPAPGTLDAVLEMARVAQMQDFDRARVLWEVTLIEGLADGGAALLCKFHHALTDGVGGVKIAMNLFTVAERRQQPAAPAAAVEVPAASWFSRYRDAWRYGAGVLAGAVRGTVTAVPGLVYHGVRQPMAAVGSATEAASSVYRTVRPVNRTGSPLMTQRSMIRRLGVHQVPLAQLREAAHRGGGSLNDAFLAGVTGGLRRYHEEHGVTIGDLHLTMPINLRTEADPLGGNRITLMRFDVPAGVTDPARRIAEIHGRAGAVRHERSLPYTQAIAGALNLMPRWYIGSILRHVDFVASDVPGLPVRVFLGGAPVSMQYAFGPTIGAAVNVTLLTYVDTCALGVNADAAAIPDYDVFHRALVAGFDEVLALAD